MEVEIETKEREEVKRWNMGKERIANGEEGDRGIK